MSLVAVWAPGLPHLMFPQQSTHWIRCADAMKSVGERIKVEKPERIVLYSTQWLSVLGTSFQADPNPRGIHVDENWYELGDLPFDLKVDGALADCFSKALASKGLPAKSVNYEGFPIDTGTITTLHYLNPEKVPVSIVSSWVYADAVSSKTIGATLRTAAKEYGKRTLFIVSSMLSNRLFTVDIDPEADRISQISDDNWNRKVLATWEAGNFVETRNLAPAFADEAKADMRFNGFHWLTGALGEAPVRGRIVHYGPLWGAGAGVVEFYED